MAERRMFAKTIIDSDAFLEMSTSAQALYFHLCMRADDDGFLNNPRKIQRMVGASEDDLKLLLVKRFILAFESGVIVIKHWRIHNYIRGDRYKETIYETEKSTLMVKENKSYTEAENAPSNLGMSVGIPSDNQMDTNGIPNDNQWSTQVRLGKDRLGKVSIDNNTPISYISEADCEKNVEKSEFSTISAEMHDRAAASLERAGFKDAAREHYEAAEKIRRLNHER